MLLSHLYFVASAFLLALGAVLAKVLLSFDRTAGTSIDPLPFLTLQLLGGVAFLLAVRLGRQPQRLRACLLVRPALAGMVLGLGSIGTIMALALISVSEASVVFATQPVMMIGMAWFLLGERTGLRVATLSVMAVGGVVVIILGGDVDASSRRLSGLAFAFLSTASAALYVIWMRALSGKLDDLSALIVVQSVACLLSAIAWRVVFATDLAPTGIGTATLAWSAFGTGMIYYGAAYYAYLIGLRDTEASVAGAYLSLVPVFAIALAWLLLAERLTGAQWIGAAVVVCAVGAISVQSARENRPIRSQVE